MLTKTTFTHHNTQAFIPAKASDATPPSPHGSMLFIYAPPCAVNRMLFLYQVHMVVCYLYMPLLVLWIGYKEWYSTTKLFATKNEYIQPHNLSCSYAHRNVSPMSRKGVAGVSVVVDISTSSCSFLLTVDKTKHEFIRGSVQKTSSWSHGPPSNVFR